MIVAVFIVLLQSTPLSDTENSLSSVFFYTIVFVWWLTKNTALVSCSLWAKYLEELMSSKQATNKYFKISYRKWNSKIKLRKVLKVRKRFIQKFYCALEAVVQSSRLAHQIEGYMNSLT